MFVVHVTPKHSKVRREMKRFFNEDNARSYAEKLLRSFRGGVAEIMDDREGAFIRSTICSGGR